MLTLISDALVFVGGFVACWFCKDTILKWALGAKSLADKLEAKAAIIKGAL